MSKKFRTSIFLTFLSLFIIPSSVLAYSSKLLVGGQNIGITIESKGIIVVGTYEVDGKDIAVDAGLKSGDIITSINGKFVSNIDAMINQINSTDNKTIKVGYLHNSKEKETTLKLVVSDNVYKTGLYVKDSISGIGTLTYIDPNTKMYGALGHEVLESNTGIMLEVKDGKIFNSTVTSIDRSEAGTPGSKNATLDKSTINGNILKNTESGIFGNYTNDLPDSKLYKVANYEDIKIGNATILTVLDDNKIKEYNINIIKLNNSLDNKTKNILFEVMDDTLLSKTGGIVQGMSGSPIIQGNYIIGAVTHVVVDNPKKGYGILITNMLEESEK